MPTLTTRLKNAIKRALTDERSSTELISTLEAGGEVTQSEFDTLEGRVDAAETDVGTLDGRVDTLETDLNTLEATVAAISVPVVTPVANFSANPTLINGTAKTDIGSYTLNLAKFSRLADRADIKIAVTSNAARATLEDLLIKLNEFSIDLTKNPVGTHVGDYEWFDPTTPGFKFGGVKVRSATELELQKDASNNLLGVDEWDLNDTLKLTIEALAIDGWS